MSFAENLKAEFKLDWLAKIILPLVAKIIDAAVKGEELPDNGEKVVQSLYALAMVWGQDLVESTETETDDEVLQAFIDLCKDTSEEGEFPLPIFE